MTRRQQEMKVDGVFAGGGVTAFSFVGAMQVMEENGFEFERVAGTSAGAITAALIKAGYNSDELCSLLDELDMTVLKDERFTWLPFQMAKWFLLYFRLGLYKGEMLEKWLEDVLAKRNIKTFSDFPCKSIKIIASDLTRGRLIVLPDDLVDYGICPEQFSVARAVRMSCSIPFFFEPIKLHDKRKNKPCSYIVDGGVLSNFPMWLFKDGENNKGKRPAIGFQLTPNVQNLPPNVIYNATTMFRALFETMSSAQDRKSTRLNSSHVAISYAVFCLKNKTSC